MRPSTGHSKDTHNPPGFTSVSAAPVVTCVNLLFYGVPKLYSSPKVIIIQQDAISHEVTAVKVQCSAQPAPVCPPRLDRPTTSSSPPPLGFPFFVIIFLFFILHHHHVVRQRQPLPPVFLRSPILGCISAIVLDSFSAGTHCYLGGYGPRLAISTSYRFLLQFILFHLNHLIFGRVGADPASPVSNDEQPNQQQTTSTITQHF